MKRFFPMLLTAMAAAGAMSCKGPGHPERASGAVTVKVMTVHSGQGSENTSHVGTVHPCRSVLLLSPYPGTLAALEVSQGESVEKGQVLARVESASVESAYKMARATLEQAEDGYARVLQVHETGSIAQVKKVEVEAQLAKARAAAEAAGSMLEEGKVKAPFPGVIGEVHSSQGVEVSMQEPLVRLMDVSRLEIHFPVPEKEIGSLSVGDSALLVVPALNDFSCKARVTAKGMVASALAHSYTCVAEPESPVEGLLPGMVCKVYLASAAGKGMVVPVSVVQMDGSGKYVWVVADSVVEKRYVTLGGFSGQGVLVVSGLENGEKVIVAGSRKVSSGSWVKIQE